MTYASTPTLMVVSSAPSAESARLAAAAAMNWPAAAVMHPAPVAAAVAVAV